MFAVIEFGKRDCAIAPLSWLNSNHDKCCWPIIKSQDTLDELITNAHDPKSAKFSWSWHKVVKIHHIAAQYKDASSFLTKLLEENSASSSEQSDANKGIIQPLSRKEVDQSDDEETPEKKRAMANAPEMNVNKKTRYEECSSSDEFSEEEPPSATITSQNVNIEKNVDNVRSDTTASTITIIGGSAISESGLSNGDTAVIPTVLLKRIEHIIAVQEQQGIILDNIERHVNATTSQRLVRPPDIPNLPIGSKQDYRDLEKFLQTEEKFLYLKMRLATIGGSNVRNTVMNMLKFIISNKVAVKFNWSGRDKKPFSRTKMNILINDAVKFSYRDRAPADLTDENIKDAIQSWLKLAKARMSYENKNLNK